MTPADRQPDLAGTRRDLCETTDALIEATHVGEPRQVALAQRRWNAAVDALIEASYRLAVDDNA